MIDTTLIVLFLLRLGAFLALDRQLISDECEFDVFLLDAWKLGDDSDVLVGFADVDAWLEAWLTGDRALFRHC